MRRIFWRSLFVLGCILVGGMLACAVGPTPDSELSRTGKIVFVRQHSSPFIGAIYTMHADGTHQQRLTELDANNLFPEWSPDGERIVFVSQRDGNEEIYVMEADGSHQRRVTQHPARDTLPTWSPDQTQIAFVRDFEGLYIIDADGSHEQRLADGGGSPAWSPDGAAIAFFAQDAIFTVSPAGGPPTHLVDLPFPDETFSFIGRMLAWSPDGTRLLFTAERAGKVNIYGVHADGDHMEQLTDTTRWYSMNPTWSPDGTQILFVSDQRLDAPLQIINADGSNQRPALEDWKRYTQPHWAP